MPGTNLACCSHLVLSVPRFNVLGVGLHAMISRSHRVRAGGAARAPQRLVCVTGVHGVSRRRTTRNSRRAQRRLSQHDDGMPLVWLGRRAFGSWVDRVYGPDLMLQSLAPRSTPPAGISSTGRAGVAEELKRGLKLGFPA